MENSRRFDPNQLINNWNDQLGDIYKEAEETLFPNLINLKKLKNRYDLASKVGEGGEKVIDRVYDKQAGRFVAMARPVKKELEDYEHFLNEAKLLTNLQHPNIIPVYDIGMVEEEPFFTMEYLQAGNLKDLLKTDKKINLEIFLKVCDAIAYAHSNGILNLDIKPENIHIGAFSKVYVLDWGLACAWREQTLDDKNQIKGTPGFIAPEQLNPVQKLGRHTDIYQLGALLYCITYKKAPIEGKSIEQIFRKTLDGHVSSVEKSQNQRRLNSIISKAMARNPVDRYKSVLDLKRDLQLYLDGFATSVEDDSFFIQLKLLFNRHKTICFLSLFFILFVTFSSSIFLSELSHKEKLAEYNQLKTEALLAKNENLKKTHDEMEFGVINAIKSILAAEQDPNTRNKILLSSTYGLFDSHHYEAAKVFALEVLKHQPYNDKVWMSLGYLHFIRFEFNDAITAFQKSKNQEIVQKLIHISEKYKNNPKLTNHQIAELILQPINIPSWNWLKHHILSSHRYRNTIAKHLDLIRIVLAQLNPSATVNFNYVISENRGILSFEKSKMIKTILLSKPDKTVFDSLDLQELHLDGHGYIEGIDHLENRGVFIIY